MSHDPDRQRRNRIVIETPSARSQRSMRPASRKSARGREGIVAISVIAAAALATFLALFITSRPYDPMNSTVTPQQNIPQGGSVTPSPKPSPTTTPSPQANQSPAVGQTPEPRGTSQETIPDDAGIQSQIEKVLASDAALSKLDISTLVENGKVTIVGSVKSSDLKLRIERAVRSVKGVVRVDNQLVVSEATP